MDREAWNERYRQTELVWGEAPNRFLQEAWGDRPASGRALDLACGQGRNAIWLAERGWQVTGVDFSEVAIARGLELARSRGIEVEWICADASRYAPEPGAYALVVIAYLQVPAPERQRVLERAASALSPGGELFMIGHARLNLAEGTGGPRSPEVLWEPEEIARELAALSLRSVRCEHVQRSVDTEAGRRQAIDAQIEARRPRA